MNKCDCYREGIKAEPRYDQYTGNYVGGVDVKYGYCTGTKELDECSCGGDCAKCDFYSEVREKAVKEENFIDIDSCEDNSPVLYYFNKSENGIGKIDYNPYKNIIIYAETIELYQKGLGITIDIPNDILGKIENIEINGYKFVKEKSYE